MNKLVSHPYTNYYLGKCNLWTKHQTGQRLSCNKCTRWYREMSFQFLSHVPGSQTVLINSGIYGSIYCLMNSSSFIVSSTNLRWCSAISSVHKNLLFWCTFYLHVYLGPQASVLFEHEVRTAIVRYWNFTMISRGNISFDRRMISDAHGAFSCYFSGCKATIGFFSTSIAAVSVLVWHSFGLVLNPFPRHTYDM